MAAVMFSWIHCPFASDYCILIISLQEQKSKLRSNLGRLVVRSVKLCITYRVTIRVCTTLPHVVDVNWRLDYHVKVGVVKFGSHDPTII